MKRADIEKLAKDMDEAGYEILSVKPLPWSFDSSPKKIINGAYNIKIAPIGECEADRAKNKG